MSKLHKIARELEQTMMFTAECSICYEEDIVEDPNTMKAASTLHDLGWNYVEKMKGKEKEITGLLCPECSSKADFLENIFDPD